MTSIQVWRCVVAFIGIHSLAVAATEDEGFSSEQLAVIKGTDGFVNVHSRPDSGSDIVLKLQEDEFFVCEPEGADWWRVKDFFGHQGYVQSSRLHLVKDLPGKDLERLFVNPATAPEDKLAGIEEASKLFRIKGEWQPVPGKLQLFPSASLFSNDELRQCVFVTHHTDGMLPLMLLFRSTDIPDAIFEQMEIHAADGSVASLDAKKDVWPDLRAASIKIPVHHFQTEYGLKLGDRVSKAFGLFGPPHNQQRSQSVSIYEWGYPGGFYYGWEYGEASVGFLDSDRVNEDGTIRKLSLGADQLEKLRARLLNTDFQQSLLNTLEGTRGSRVNLGLGFRVKLYVRDDKVDALSYEWGFE